MDAIKLLEKDHKRLRKLLDQGKKAEELTPGRRSRVYELLAHERREEEVLFPELKRRAATKQMTLEALEEHQVANGVLADLDGTPPSDENWPARFKVLTEVVEHHLDEEEHDLFPKAGKVLDDEQLEAMGAEMQAMGKDRRAPAG
jgi:hemerythrin-like domain-containing protein